jgi:hypothetical protein
LRHEAEKLAHVHNVLQDAVPIHARIARRREEPRRQHRDGGRLAGAVGTEQAEHLAFVYLEIEAGDGFDVTVLLAQSRHMNGGRTRARGSRM